MVIFYLNIFLYIVKFDYVIVLCLLHKVLFKLCYKCCCLVVFVEKFAQIVYYCLYHFLCFKLILGFMKLCSRKVHTYIYIFLYVWIIELTILAALLVIRYNISWYSFFLLDYCLFMLCYHLILGMEETILNGSKKD